ncbi:hypothetical protein [Bacillus atrophaeus]|uniref:hypothetical protein n=1 Tax=Bacillus atrophaeus TaxID=1452 RepID=UPI002281B3BF|nr:hypothetical protein [Bacillus atrophaeus]MCY8932524.1 hypothetical protein [Bacillus atrophaeus]MCY8942315.1 hypothetical protein [Bacillus atrophaeus]
MALRILFLLMGCGFWIYFQHDYRPDMEANLALIGAIISFTAAAYFKDIDKYIKKEEKG